VVEERFVDREREKERERETCTYGEEEDYFGFFLSFFLFQHCGTMELDMGWLRLVGSRKLYVSFAEYRLFYRALLFICFNIVARWSWMASIP